MLVCSEKMVPVTCREQAPVPTLGSSYLGCSSNSPAGALGSTAWNKAPTSLCLLLRVKQMPLRWAPPCNVLHSTGAKYCQDLGLCTSLPFVTYPDSITILDKAQDSCWAGAYMSTVSCSREDPLVFCVDAVAANKCMLRSLIPCVSCVNVVVGSP